VIVHENIASYKECIVTRSTDGILTLLTEVEEFRSFVSLPRGRTGIGPLVPVTAARREDVWKSGSITTLLSTSALDGDEWSAS
jgi:hypothetical protein